MTACPDVQPKSIKKPTLLSSRSVFAFIAAYQTATTLLALSTLFLILSIGHRYSYSEKGQSESPKLATPTDCLKISSSGGAASGKGGSSAGGSTYSGGASSNGGSQTGNAANICTGTSTACGGDPTGTLDIVSVCVQGVLAAAANISYAQTLDQQSGTIATCSSGNSLCDCVYTTDLPATADTYTVDGTSLVASDGSSTEFCVQGSTMTQRDSFGNNTYAVTRFSKR